MKDLTLNQLEQTRLHVLNSVLEHQLPVAQAAEILGVSERHAWANSGGLSQGGRRRTVPQDTEAAAAPATLFLTMRQPR